MKEEELLLLAFKLKKELAKHLGKEERQELEQAFEIITDLIAIVNYNQSKEVE